MNKITTLAEYQQLAARTCPDLGSPEANLQHMNLGVITEIGEFLDPIKKNLAYGKPLDVVNLGEELADIAWYIANRARMFFPVTWEEVDKNPETTFEATMVDFRETFGDCPSGTTEVIELAMSIMPSPEEFEINSRFGFVGTPSMAMILAIAEHYKLDFWQILTNNITKLKVRYPEKFTEEAALNRDLTCERKALEKDI